MCSLYVGRDVSCQHIALVVFIACHLCITSRQGGSLGVIFADGETEALGVVWTEGTRGLEACWNPELHWRCFLASLPHWLQEQIRDASHGWLEVSRGAAQLKMGSVVFVCLFSELLSRWYGFKIAAAFKVKTSCCCSCSKKLVPWSDTKGADSQLATAAALPGPSFFSPQHHAEKASNMVGAWSAFAKGYAKYLFFSPGVFSELPSKCWRAWREECGMGCICSQMFSAIGTVPFFLHVDCQPGKTIFDPSPAALPGWVQGIDWNTFGWWTVLCLLKTEALIIRLFIASACKFLYRCNSV